MKSLFRKACLLLPALLMAGNLSAATVWLDDLNLKPTIQDWGDPHKNMSVDAHVLSIGGVHYAHGMGTHARSTLFINLAGGAKTFSASVGVDDEVSPNVGSVDFQVIGDGNTLWDSGAMRVGDRAKQFKVNLKGVKILELSVMPAKDDISYDHADWADAKFKTTGAAPVTMSAPPEDAVILTPPAPPTPRINGAKIFGVRPGNPFLFTIAATGDQPMTFSAENLPEGLTLDPATGRITGQINQASQAGAYEVTLGAKNALGTAQEKFKIVCGPQIALTPPMGWNSWNCFAGAVSADKVRSAADVMVKSGLANHGWTYINIDDYWQTHKDSTDPTLQGPRRDAQGRILPNPRFPDMKGLADYVHGLGLKIGLYSSPGPWTCGGCVGSFGYEFQDAQQYADWGFDYLKYDWCSYRPDMENQRGQAAIKPPLNANVPPDIAQLMVPYQDMADALHQQHRDIVFSLCQYGMGDVWKWGASVGGSLWRTTGDISDTWGSMSANGFSSVGHEQYAGPGHWNDPDMLVVGRLGWGSLRPTRLTPNEQYTHISLWCLLASPLLIGCDMSQLDDFTLSLLSNDEVLAVDQDPLGKQASRVAKAGSTEVWAKDMEDGSKAVGLFNRGEGATQVTINWASLGWQGSAAHRVRDLWRQKDLGNFSDSFTATVPRHGVVLIRVW
jgi:alpha-galactosidase